MLALTRKPGQQIMIGNDITINIVEVKGDNVRIAVDAPREIRIYRGELLASIARENKQAAESLDKSIDLSDILTKS